MPYIGKSPQQGNYSKLDDFSGDFDGSDATHAIASGGTAIDPITPNALIISINGVIQEPATDYTVSGSNITFTTAPAAGDNFFGVALGEGVSIGTPSNSTITAAKLSSAVLTGHTDIGAAIADADLLLVDDGAGGTLRKTAASRIKTYVEASAMAVTGNVTATGTVEPAGDTSAGDNAAIGYTSAEGLILTGQGSTDDITIKNDADTTVVNVATGATDVEVSAGNILFGTSSKGVYLGVTSATAANLLDDYEEGTWTPDVRDASNNGGTSESQSYGSNNSGFYTKIGRVVNASFVLQITSLGTLTTSYSGRIVGGLPFTSSSTATSWFAGSIAYATGLATTDALSMYVSSGDTGIQMTKWGVSTGTEATLLSDLSADGLIIGSVWYRV